MKSYNLAIVGATGLVGKTFLKVLEEYNFPIKELKLFASTKSEGKLIKFKNKDYLVETIKKGSFIDVDFALFSAGAKASKLYAKQAVNEGAVVIDNSSAWRMNKEVPLVVPEVNLRDAFNQKLIANPNCSTIQSVIPLKALNDAFGVIQVEFNTYQAVSGSGYSGLADLELTKLGKKPEFYPDNISDTCIPQIADFMDDGYTLEELKMINETRKILHLENLKISVTCVRVPVAYSHAVSARIKLSKPGVSLADIRNTLKNQESIIVLDEPKKNIYPTSTKSNNTDYVYVGRIRRDKIDENTILIYIVADNIRKGAASNAIQIMKGMVDNDNCS